MEGEMKKNKRRNNNERPREWGGKTLIFFLLRTSSSLLPSRCAIKLAHRAEAIESTPLPPLLLLLPARLTHNKVSPSSSLEESFFHLSDFFAFAAPFYLALLRKKQKPLK